MRTVFRRLKLVGTLTPSKITLILKERPVLKKPTASPSGNKKKGAANTNEVNNGANSSGSSFMNVKNSSTSNTPIIDKIRKFEDLLIDGQSILVDEAGIPLKKVECPGDYDSKDKVALVDNDMDRSLASEKIDPYDDDMYEGHDLSQEIQAICDNLDIRVRGRKKK
ncbi:hypothetical protein Tco_1518319 [Tanacetum coccineum]